MGLMDLAKDSKYLSSLSKASARFKNVPLKSTVGAVGAGIGALAYGAATAAPVYESEGQATSDGMNSYDTEETSRNYQYGLSDRLASMNVSGDLVFGLHNKRHG